MEDTVLITPVYDWKISMTNWFDRDDTTELRKNDLTFEMAQKVVDKFRAKYPRHHVMAVAFSVETTTFISCQPLEKEQDDENLSFEEWKAKWHPNVV